MLGTIPNVLFSDFQVWHGEGGCTQWNSEQALKKAAVQATLEGLSELGDLPQRSGETRGSKWA